MKKKGRTPSFKVTPEVLKEVEVMAGNGLTQIQIAAYYGVTYATLNNAKIRDKSLDFAIKKGKSKSILFVTGKLMEKIKQGNLSAIIFYLKTQAGWNEKSTLELKDKIKSKKSDYKLDTMDAIEASKIYQSIMTGSYKDERNSSS